jgi:DNA (cytosine-5)-methyltransferase 1
VIRYGSVCSGVEAASVAWHPLGWRPQWFAEIEPFPSAVLAHRWPGVPNFGDFTLIGGDVAAIDLLVGGTPCQSFSVAGLRGGLLDDRGQLALEFLRLARRLGPRWIVWENVPGVLSSNGGRDFGSFLGGLVELGYGFAYRVLDAQYFGVPQKRRRVFVVAHLGNWRRAATVLFERASSTRDLASVREEEARREVRQDGSNAAPSRCAGEWWDGRGVSQTLDAVLYKKQALPEKNRFPAVAVPVWVACDGGCEDFVCQLHLKHVHDCECPALDAWSEHDLSPYLPSLLRFISPVEAERLMGFPDDYTLVPVRGKPASDTPRYKALGNSMAVPVMRWIGERIAAVESSFSSGNNPGA